MSSLKIFIYTYMYFQKVKLELGYQHLIPKPGISTAPCCETKPMVPSFPKYPSSNYLPQEKLKGKPINKKKCNVVLLL